MTRPSTLFIKLSQLEKVNMFKGKQSIYFILANNNGQRITRITGDITICSSYPPTDLITVSSEMTLDGSYSYPVTFSVMVSTMAGGEQGKGSYILKAYSTDRNFKLSPMS